MAEIVLGKYKIGIKKIWEKFKVEFLNEMKNYIQERWETKQK